MSPPLAGAAWAAIGNYGEAEHSGESRGFPHRRFRYDRLPHGLVLLFASIVVVHALCYIRSVVPDLAIRQGVKNLVKGASPRATEITPPQPAESETIKGWTATVGEPALEAGPD